MKGYVCQNCNYRVPKWVGNCPECHNWNSFEHDFASKNTNNQIVKNALKGQARSICDIEINHAKRLKSNCLEFDRVVGGGIVQGSLLLLGGEPGVGKSTLLAKVLQGLALNYGDESLLYCSGEESLSQVAVRFKRLQVDAKNILLINEIVWERIRENLNDLKPKVLILDSIQTTVSAEIDSAAGSVSQVKEVTYQLMNHCKANNITCLIIGHINKEGSIAGPKLLEHMVDGVIYFEAEDSGLHRILRSIKNRFGKVGEVGIFEMTEKGLCEVENSTQHFQLDNNSYGRALSCINEGSRTSFFEVQSLVMESSGASRKSSIGIDINRLNLLCAIIEKYCSISLSYKDVYLNIVGGKRVTSRDTDLSIVASLISSYCEKPIKINGIFIGEVGLTGEIRTAYNIEMRVKEAAHLKYDYLVTSSEVAKKFKDKYPIELIGIDKVRQIEKFL